VPDSSNRKLIYAEALKTLMARKAFSKISVGDIVDVCGLTRQSFYYHFKDKYDLMNWIYYTETARFMTSCDTLDHWTDGLKELCDYMRQNKTFYRNALNTTGQNSFPEYLNRYIKDLSTSAVEKITSAEYDSIKWDFLVSFFATAFVAFIVRWSDNGMKEDPAEFITKIRGLFDGSMLCELESGNHGEDVPANIRPKRKGQSDEEHRRLHHGSAATVGRRSV